MDNKKKTNTKNLWMYAVLLFTSAFVVLVLTAYSQIKFNSRIDDYQTTLENEQSQKNEVSINLNQALAENKAILDDLEKLKETNATIKSENDNLRLENKNLSSINKSIAGMYEKYMSASAKYYSGDSMGAAFDLFVDFDVTMLIGESKNNAEEMMSALRPGLAEKAYLMGYSQYSANNWQGALNLFRLSLAVSKDYYFSDDCYYLSAYCYKTLGNNSAAADNLKALLDSYPSSDLAADSKTLYDKIKQGE